MIPHFRKPTLTAGLMLATAACFMASPREACAQWPGWGGPHRNFQADATGLAAQWPENGPKRLWRRSLGDGYSSIAVADGKLYTMYRTGDQEVAVALSAADGKTVWEQKYEAPWVDGVQDRFGEGPGATPYIADHRVYSLGRTGRLTCLNAKTGHVNWSHDLIAEYEATSPKYGFASSPIVYKDTLLVAVGGEGVGVMAFDAASGKVKWKKHDFVNMYSSPLVIDVDDQDQVVLLVDREVVGLNPDSGELLWRHPHVNQWKTNICTPLWTGKDHLLYVSAGGEAGSRALKLTQKNGATTVREMWVTRKMGAGHTNVIRVGDFFYSCVGYGAATFMGAVNAKDGKIVWKERGFPNGTMVYGDGKLIVLDEDGRLTLAEPTPEKLNVLSKFELFKKTAWTAPVLVGRTLYARDKETIVAVDLGKG